MCVRAVFFIFAFETPNVRFENYILHQKITPHHKLSFKLNLLSVLYNALKGQKQLAWGIALRRFAFFSVPSDLYFTISLCPL